MNKSLKIGIIGGIATIIIILVGFSVIQNIKQSDTESIVEQSIDENPIIMELKITTQEYNELRYSDKENTVVIFPIFTAFAYEENGFYDYYNGNCDESCLTVKIDDEPPPLHHSSSEQGVVLLRLLGYPYLTDIEISKNPGILKNYDKIIMLHNEYVTQNEFNAITSHPNVIYLYPNAMMAKVEFDQEANTITLIRGHYYPEKQIKNGFDWEFDNTHPYEYDTNCIGWEFYEIDNGHMLNCYPEKVITEKLDIIHTMKKY